MYLNPNACPEIFNIEFACTEFIDKYIEKLSYHEEKKLDPEDKELVSKITNMFLERIKPDIMFIVASRIEDFKRGFTWSSTTSSNSETFVLSDSEDEITPDPI